jgi:hypothetical protein
VRQIILSALPFLVALLSLTVWAQVKDRGTDGSAYERRLLSHSENEDAADTAMEVEVRTSDPPTCVRNLTGAIYFNTTSRFLCMCVGDATPNWEQVHSPGTATGCGN